MWIAKAVAVAGLISILVFVLRFKNYIGIKQNAATSVGVFWSLFFGNPYFMAGICLIFAASLFAFKLVQKPLP